MGGMCTWPGGEGGVASEQPRRAGMANGGWVECIGVAGEAGWDLVGHAVGNNERATAS